MFLVCLGPTVHAAIFGLGLGPLAGAPLLCSLQSLAAKEIRRVFRPCYAVLASELKINKCQRGRAPTAASSHAWVNAVVCLADAITRLLPVVRQ